MKQRTISPVQDWRGALAASDLPWKAKLVGGFGLANYMSSRGTNAFPSLVTLADDCSVSKSTVAEALALLVGEGWLVKEAGGGRGHRSAYEAVIPETVRNADSSSGDGRSRGGSSGASVRPLRAVESGGSEPTHLDGETVADTDGLRDGKLSASASETVRGTDANCPPGGTELDQEVDQEAAAAASRDASAELAELLNPGAAAAELTDALTSISAGARLVEAARREPERALAWITVARDEAHTNPAGFVMGGLKQPDEWPSPRGSFTSSTSKQSWVDDACWKLELEHAHSIVEEWENIDDAERAIWHQAVDDKHAARAIDARVAAEDAA